MMSDSIMSDVKRICNSWERGDAGSEFCAKRIMELFRNEAKKGAEGSLHRIVGAPVGADGGKRKCPNPICEFGIVFNDTEWGTVMEKCPTCGATEAVADTNTTTEVQQAADPQTSGSPALGPQARSGEEESDLADWCQEILDTSFKDYEAACDWPRWKFWQNKKFLQRRSSFVGDAFCWFWHRREANRRTDDGERSEHRGPNVRAERPERKESK